jgi:plastocyanin
MLASRLAVSLMFCVPLVAPALAQAPAPVQTINVANYRFMPEPVRLAAGHLVTLTFANQSGSSHNFASRAFFASSTITSGSAPGGKIELSGHETKSITLIPRAGTYEAHCSHFLHASMGMTDQIIVS